MHTSKCQNTAIENVVIGVPILYKNFKHAHLIINNIKYDVHKMPM